MINIEQYKLPGDVLKEVALRAVKRRKEYGLTQVELATKSGVSLGSIKRFERTYQISFASLVNIAFALNCEDDFSALFSQKHYQSIEDVIAESKKR